jgi:hypothetical protein
MTSATFRLSDDLAVNLSALIDTRLLVQANSGGGKSWCLRRILEQTHGRVQHLVIDPEGEFASLRERFDYVLAARQGGDTAADPRSAKLLAERLLELGASAILDIYELKADERVRFVRAFLEALVDAPKKLWHPALVVLDEAHVYCPEKGDAESAGAVVDLATRGRKRGFCAILATQRLSKLKKDAAAECNNKLIGRTGLDVDMDRAGEELGMAKNSRLVLRELGAGEFFGFGPAISQSVTRVHVGAVLTSHPKTGSRIAFTAPPPTEKVRALLPKLADLPAEAEARQKTVEDLRKELATARRELTIAKQAAPAPAAVVVERVEVPVLVGEDRGRIDALVQALREASKFTTARADEIGDSLARIVQALKAEPPRKVSVLYHAPARKSVTPLLPRRVVESNGHGSITPARQKILNGLAFLDGIGTAAADKTQLALLIGVSPTSGGYFNNLGALRSAGLIEYPSGGTVALTDAGARVASTDGVPQTTEELHAAIQAKLPAAKWRIVEALIQVYPKAVEKDVLAEQIEVSPTSGGYFNNLGSLRSLGLIDYPRPGHVVAKPLLFLE